MPEVQEEALLLQKSGRRLLLSGHSGEGSYELRQSDKAGPAVGLSLLQSVSDAVYAGVVHLCQPQHNAGDQAGAFQRKLPLAVPADTEEACQSGHVSDFTTFTQFHTTYFTHRTYTQVLYSVAGYSTIAGSYTSGHYQPSQNAA